MYCYSNYSGKTSIKKEFQNQISHQPDYKELAGAEVEVTTYAVSDKKSKFLHSDNNDN